MKKTNVEILVIGAGQTGLTVGQYLRSVNCSFLLVDANKSVGDSWRARYDRMRLLTPRADDMLPGMMLSGDPLGYPTKDEFADYLKKYAAHYKFPISMSTKIHKLIRARTHFVAETNQGKIWADFVVIATGSHQKPYVPALSHHIKRTFYQIHSSTYKNPRQLPAGTALIVGGGHSGLQIAIDVSRYYPVILVTKRRFVFSKSFDFLYTILLHFYGTKTVGRIADVLKLRRVNTNELDVLLQSKKIIIKPEIDYVDPSSDIFYFSDHTSCDPKSVIWATGFEHDYSWIDIPGVWDYKKNVLCKNYSNAIGGMYFIYPEKTFGFIRDLPSVVGPVIGKLLKVRGDLP